MGFVHLHVHTAYSFLDGMIKVDELVKRVKKLDQKAVAVTDHGNIAAAIPLIKAAKEQDIKPIIGMEAYLAPASMEDRVSSPPWLSDKRPYYHITLLALSKLGYINLVKLTNESYRRGFYYKPRIDFDLLCECSEDLVILSGCVGGEMGVLNTNNIDITGLYEKYVEMFGDRYFLEMSYNGDKDTRTGAMQKSLCNSILRLDDLDRTVFTVDSHYELCTDHDIHDALISVGAGTYREDPKRRIKFYGSYHIKNETEVKAFGYPQQVYDNTERIADMVEDYGLLSKKFFLPEIAKYPESDLTELCRQTVPFIYGTKRLDAVARMNEELDVILNKGFAQYFLILYDIVMWAESKGIVLGYGRGSAAGSIVSYLLNITKIDPLKYGLLFSRFMNKEREDLPDIDIDIEDVRRDEVIEYIRKKYGGVIQIGSFGTIGAKLAIKDMGRAFRIPIPVIDKICNQIPDDAKLEDLDPDIFTINKLPPEFYNFCKRIEGNPRQFTIHAAGIVFVPPEKVALIPIYVKNDKEITQYDMNIVRDMGMLKMDFLGLRTLRVISEGCRLANITREEIPLDDIATFDLICRGDLDGVFQLEGEGFKNMVMDLHPKDFHTLIDTMALYRPSVIENGDMYRYIKRYRGEEEVSYFFNAFKEILDETLGICLYQEQVMEIAKQFAKYTDAEADSLRRIMGKKKKELLPQEKGVFIERAQRAGHAEQLADEVFEYIATFAGYGFNKAHATSYAFLSYWTAYLSANYSLEFYTAILNSVIHNQDRVRGYLLSASHQEIKILPPNINQSSLHFTVNKAKGAILYGLVGVKYLGDKAVTAILETRVMHGDFVSAEDFRERIPKKALNSRAYKVLLEVGAFDGISDFRGNMSYVAKLQAEFEYLGMFVSGNPLDEYDHSNCVGSIDEVVLGASNMYQIILLVNRIHKHKTKNEQKLMAFLTCMDRKGEEVDVVVFPDVWANSEIVVGDILKMVGVFGIRHDKLNIQLKHSEKLNSAILEQ